MKEKKRMSKSEIREGQRREREREFKNYFFVLKF